MQTEPTADQRTFYFRPNHILPGDMIHGYTVEKVRNNGTVWRQIIFTDGSSYRCHIDKTVEVWRNR